MLSLDDSAATPAGLMTGDLFSVLGPNHRGKITLTEFKFTLTGEGSVSERFAPCRCSLLDLLWNPLWRRTTFRNALRSCSVKR